MNAIEIATLVVIFGTLAIWYALQVRNAKVAAKPPIENSSRVS